MAFKNGLVGLSEDIWIRIFKKVPDALATERGIFMAIGSVCRLWRKVGHKISSETWTNGSVGLQRDLWLNILERILDKYKYNSSGEQMNNALTLSLVCCLWRQWIVEMTLRAVKYRDHSMGRRTDQVRQNRTDFIQFLTILLLMGHYFIDSRFLQLRRCLLPCTWWLIVVQSTTLSKRIPIAHFQHSFYKKKLLPIIISIGRSALFEVNLEDENETLERKLKPMQMDCAQVSKMPFYNCRRLLKETREYPLYSHCSPNLTNIPLILNVSLTTSQVDWPLKWYANQTVVNASNYAIIDMAFQLCIASINATFVVVWEFSKARGHRILFCADWNPSSSCDPFQGIIWADSCRHGYTRLRLCAKSFMSCITLNLHHLHRTEVVRAMLYMSCFAKSSLYLTRYYR